MDDSAPRLAMVAGEASGDLLAGLLLGGLRAALAGPARPSASAGRSMAAQGFEAWWPHDKLAVRGYVEVLRHYREIAGIRNAAGRAPAADRPDVFIGVDAPDFNLGLEAQLQGRGHQDGPLRQPVDLGLARRARREDRAQPSTMCCACSRSSRRCYASARHRGDLRRPSAGRRDPAASRRAPPAAPRSGWRDDDTVVAVLPGSRALRDRSTSRRASCRPPRCCTGARPALRFVLPVAPGLRDADRAAAPQHAPACR